MVKLSKTPKPQLFHGDTFDRTIYYGPLMRRRMLARLNEAWQRTRHLKDTDISVVIRTRNDAVGLQQLMEELHSQIYDAALQIIVVDTESTDGTVAVAKAQGATVINIKQADFSYPKALNMGFAAARHPYVLTLVGHSNLSNNLTLRSLARWRSERLGGVYSITLPNYNATLTERYGSLLMRSIRHLRPAAPITKVGIGNLAANCSIISREAWQELGGFDESFGAGGEDCELARQMLANGWTIVREPVVSVHHTHGLGPIDGFKQWRYWYSLGKARDFSSYMLHAYRPDMRKKLK